MRRHVFYIHGFDPRGPAPYHAICAETAKARGIEITPRRKAGAGSSQWRLRAPGCEVAYEVLRYDDWVRELWPRWNGARRYGAALRVVFAFARSGVLTRLARWARPGFYAVLAQGFIGVAPYVLALALGAGVYAKASDWLALPYALALAAVLAGAAILLGRRLETRLNLAWFTPICWKARSARSSSGRGAPRCSLRAFWNFGGAERSTKSWSSVIASGPCWR